MKLYFNYLICFTLLTLVSCDYRGQNNDDISNKEKIYEEHYDDGKIKIKGIFFDGRKNGVWKQYSIKGKVEKAEYFYMDTLIHVLNASDFDLNEQKLSDGSLIALPSLWNIQQNYKEALILAVKPEVKEPETFNPTINVVVVSLADSIQLERAVKLNLDQIKNSLKDMKVKEVAKINNDSLLIIRTLYFADTGTQKLGVLSGYIKSNQTLYIITCIAQGDQLQFVKYKNLFEDIILSFKVN